MRRFLLGMICSFILVISDAKGLQGNSGDDEYTPDASIYENVRKMMNLLYDHPDPDDEMVIIPGLKTRVKNCMDKMDSMDAMFDAVRQSMQAVTDGQAAITSTLTDLSSQFANMQESVAEQKTIVDDISRRMDAIDSTIDERMSTSWEVFIEKKFEEYMEVKKQVLDIITAQRIEGKDDPTYIMETAEQVSLLDLENRRETLSTLLETLNVFETLLDGEKLESLESYLDQTKVTKPKYEEIKDIIPGLIIDGSYVRVTGATRDYTRAIGLKTGLPKKNWMNPDYDYFPYGSRPFLENLLNSENYRRNTSNAEAKRINAIRKARYEADMRAAERITFPQSNLQTLITDYNRLLTRHEI